MFETFKDLVPGTMTFKKIIEKKMVYVDKTDFLARMISSGKEAWFLSRPKCFGKSLTISTLKAVFRGKRRFLKVFPLKNI
jgi:hypothetical protein